MPSGIVGLGLVFDAVPYEEFYGVEFYADEGVRPFFASARLSVRNTAHMGTDVRRLPKQVRAVWRRSSKGAAIPWGDAHFYDPRTGQPKTNYNPATTKVKWSAEQEIENRKSVYAARGLSHFGPWASDYGDEVLGDYIASVAERVPQEADEELCNRNGALTLRFRLHPNGLLVGWSIGRASHHSSSTEVPSETTVMFGGQFREAYRWQGRVVRRGWYIHPNTQQRIETDF